MTSPPPPPGHCGCQPANSRLSLIQGYVKCAPLRAAKWGDFTREAELLPSSECGKIHKAGRPQSSLVPKRQNEPAIAQFPIPSAPAKFTPFILLLPWSCTHFIGGLLKAPSRYTVKDSEPPICVDQAGLELTDPWASVSEHWD